MNSRPAGDRRSTILASLGGTAQLVSDFDWSRTPLGDLGDWPESLMTMVNFIMRSPVAMALLWGRDGHLLYNDGYATVCGNRHPGVLGHSVIEAWPEASAFNRKVIDAVFAGGALTFRDQEFTLLRNGVAEQVWLTLDYSPLLDGDAHAVGVFAIVQETTTRVLGTQRIAAERERFGQMFAQAPSFMALLNGPEHRFEYANPAFQRLIGRRHIEGRTVAEALPDAVEQGYLARLDEVYRSGKAYAAAGAKYAVQAEAGDEARTRYLDFVYQPITDGDRKVTGIFVEGIDITDRIAAETEAKRSRARLELALINAQFIGIWEWMVPSDTVYVDPRFASFFNVDAEAAEVAEVRAPLASFLAAIHADDRERVAREIQAGLVPGANFTSEYRIRSKAHGLRHVLARGTCEFDAADKPLVLRGVVVDITDQHLANAALRATETRLSLVLQGAKDHAILTTDSQGTVTAWSNGAQAIFGWPATEIIGQPVALLFTAEDRATDVPRQEMRIALAAGRAGDERWHLRRDGGRVFMSGSMHPLPPDEDGAPQGFIKIARDETDRRLFEARREALARFADNVRDLDGALPISRVAARILGETLSASRVGYGNIDLSSRSVHIDAEWHAPGVDSLVGGFDMREYAAFLETLERGEIIQVADVMRDERTVSTGSRLHRLHARAVLNVPILEQGRLVAVLYVNDSQPREWSAADIAFVRDMAERTRTAAERARGRVALRDSELRLREANETLEAKVESRTRELMHAEEALRQAQKMEAVGQLTGGLAHDFNNLLAAISGSLELLEGRIASGRLVGLERYIGAAQSAARRAAALTQRLLAFSRRQTLDPRPTDINKLVGGMADLIRRSVGPGIDVEVVGAGGLWTTRVDASQLENALLNLCLNARDAMQPAGGRLTIETANKWLDERAARERDLAPGQYISLCVTDTGTGMPPEVAARAFDPFFTTKPLGLGTGLGLSMVYGFARQSGGQTRIYSEIGKGTTMCLYLPRYVGEIEIEADEPLAESGQGDGETVLVVDDEAAIRMLVIEVLQEIGYAAIEAADGASALRILQSEARIDLLITDVGLPGGMNGRQVADAARVVRPTLKVLFITGFAENAAIGNGHLDAGMQVMTKPFLMSALAGKIRDLIDGA